VPLFDFRCCVLAAQLSKKESGSLSIFRSKWFSNGKFCRRLIHCWLVTVSWGKLLLMMQHYYYSKIKCNRKTDMSQASLDLANLACIVEEVFNSVFFSHESVGMWSEGESKVLKSKDSTKTSSTSKKKLTQERWDMILLFTTNTFKGWFTELPNSSSNLVSFIIANWRWCE